MAFWVLGSFLLWEKMGSFFIPSSKFLWSHVINDLGVIIHNLRTIRNHHSRSQSCAFTYFGKSKVWSSPSLSTMVSGLFFLNRYCSFSFLDSKATWIISSRLHSATLTLSGGQPLPCLSYYFQQSKWDSFKFCFAAKNYSFPFLWAKLFLFFLLWVFLELILLLLFQLYHSS